MQKCNLKVLFVCVTHLIYLFRIVICELENFLMNINLICSLHQFQLSICKDFLQFLNNSFPTAELVYRCCYLNSKIKTQFSS